MILGVTGHRPRRLAIRRGDHSSLVEFATKAIHDQQPSKVVTGMQLGWDLAVARACADLAIPYVAAVPWKGFDADWNPAEQALLTALLSLAAEVVYCYPPGQYSPKKFHGRDKWIVENSNAMLALWDGYEDGGTAACVRYAQKQGRIVTNVWLDWRDFLRLRDPAPFRA